MPEQFVVRAVDTGYGHIKFADGRESSDVIRCDSFPSQSPSAGAGQLEGGGAKLYTEAIRAKFPRHEVVTLTHPAFANGGTFIPVVTMAPYAPDIDAVLANGKAIGICDEAQWRGVAG